MPNSNPEDIIIETKSFVESERSSEVKLKANGGNAILIVYEPIRETEFIVAINKLFSNSDYLIIDLNRLLMEFVEKHKSSLKDLFEQLQLSFHEIFKAPPFEESEDLYRIIIKEILDSINSGKVPILINTGALYGTGIECIHIMENEKIMSASRPIIILYPATKEPDRLMFLSKRPATKYRCMVIS
jgi:hypothetical protein